jgi:hypothetical protein
LEKWIFAFFQSVYSPTIYTWKKHGQVIDITQEDFQPDVEVPVEPIVPEEKGPQLEEYLASLEEPKEVQKEPEKPQPRPEKPPAKEPPAEEPEILLERKAPPKPTAEAEFGEIPMPEPPKTPNKVVGMLFTSEGKLIENAIIEIQDKNGNAVRALRSNRLGQFETATPLTNGEYIILVEKNDYQFDILKLEAKGEVLEPLIIRAKENAGFKQNRH